MSSLINNFGTEVVHLGKLKVISLTYNNASDRVAAYITRTDEAALRLALVTGKFLNQECSERDLIKIKHALNVFDNENVDGATLNPISSPDLIASDEFVESFIFAANQKVIATVDGEKYLVPHSDINKMIHRREEYNLSDESYESLKMAALHTDPSIDFHELALRK